MAVAGLLLVVFVVLVVAPEVVVDVLAGRGVAMDAGTGGRPLEPPPKILPRFAIMSSALRVS